MASSGASACTSCDCPPGQIHNGAGELPRESASHAESARPAKSGSSASASLQEPAWRVASASTRRRRGQICVSHARRLRSVRRNRIAAAAVATRKAPAQIAEAVLRLCFAPSARRSRKRLFLCSHGSLLKEIWPFFFFGSGAMPRLFVITDPAYFQLLALMPCLSFSCAIL
jgi:hypothetical protein